MKRLIEAIYGLLTEDKPVTATGAAHLLRADFAPVISYEEADRALEWLTRNGYAKARDGQFGPEYVKTAREPRG